jgi:hypothetical protein
MAQEKIALNLLRHFNRQVYEMVDMFMKTCPMLTPLMLKTLWPMMTMCMILHLG